MGLKSVPMRSLTTASSSNAADKGISVCSSLKEVRRTSHRARRRRGPCRAAGSRRDWSGSSRPLPPQTTPSGKKEQVRPERAVRTMPVQTLALTKPVAAPNSSKRKLAGGRRRLSAEKKKQKKNVSGFSAVAWSIASPTGNRHSLTAHGSHSECCSSIEARGQYIFNWCSHG